jgi:hypothetical protein
MKPSAKNAFLRVLSAFFAWSAEVLRQWMKINPAQSTRSSTQNFQKGFPLLGPGIRGVSADYLANHLAAVQILLRADFIQFAQQSPG